MIVGVSDCSKYSNYSNWILAAGNVEVIKLSHVDNNKDDIKRCHGLVLTGGEDIHPELYNKPEYLPYCHQEDVSRERDEFEWKLMEYTEKNGLPVLGICRGLQFANVYFGGTLIPDIPSWEKPPHSKNTDGTDRYHEVFVEPSSWLHSIVNTSSGTINSNHHQSADIIAENLVSSAVSPDGIIEALERKRTQDASFLCLVQWHPERMKDQQNEFVINIRSAFINACKQL